MPRRVVLASPTYRSYCYEWVRGLVSLFHPEAPVAARLDALGAEFIPGIAQGYGAARNLGTIIQSALALRADFLLIAEWDHAWDSRHVAQILEAEAALSATHGAGRVVIGAMYPSSGQPQRHVYKPLGDAPVGAELDERILAAETMRDEPGNPLRYIEAFVLPAGFSLWPLWMFDGLDIEERCGLRSESYWDAQASALCRESGVRPYYDLSLDVGHLNAVGVSSLDLARRARRNG